jgi:hypothetical protein
MMTSSLSWGGEVGSKVISQHEEALKQRTAHVSVGLERRECANAPQELLI